MAEPLLSPRFQARLIAVEVALRRALPSTQRGDRRSPTRKGISIEFADHRAYVPGDDVRHLDWATYARLDQLVLKLYHDEEDLQLHVLVDDSRSMDYGRPAKSRFAREVAAALAWIGLAKDVRVSVSRLGASTGEIRARRGAGALAEILQYLDDRCAGTRVPLSEACRTYAAHARPRGVVAVVSDLLDPLGLRASLDALQSPFSDVSVIQVLAPEELDPRFDGDVRLVDLETEGRVEVDVSAAVLARYRQVVKRFVSESAELCRRRGAAFAWTSSGASLEDFLLRSLVQEGVLR